MNRISSFNEIQVAIKEVKDIKKGFITNLYLDFYKLNLWINNNMLYIDRFGDSVYVLKHNINFSNLYYISADHQMLVKLLQYIQSQNFVETIVSDLIGEEHESHILKSIFESNGFYQYTSLQRMSKSSQSENISSIDLKVNSPILSQANEILFLLSTYFDPLAEQIPLLDEINHWIESDYIKIIEFDNKIVGFVIYELIGFTSYLKYWFVHPEYRNKNIGSALLRTYFNKSIHTKRQLFWVIQTNLNAIKRYMHYGFLPENVFDYVMINKYRSYETENN